MTRRRANLYQVTGEGMLRAAVSLTPPPMPAWPGPGAPAERWRAWLSVVWADDAFRQAVCGASLVLSDQIGAILEGRWRTERRVRRVGLAVARYAIRYAGRSTPYGLFAGVTSVAFSDAAAVRFGTEHTVVSRPDPSALDAAISACEADPEIMDNITVCVTDLARQRGGRLHIPADAASEFSIAMTPPVALILEAARAPIAYSSLVDKLAADFPDTSPLQRSALVAELLKVRLLRSELRAPATAPDPTPVLPVAQWSALARASDLRLDATVVLPQAVALEAATAATVLTRLARHPNGTPAWQRYAQQFAERYGEGVEVGVELLTDPEQGLGFPDGFGLVSEPPRPMSLRDRLLLDLAGTAALEGVRSVSLTGAQIEQLEAAAGDPPALTPPHLELCAQVEARSTHALDRGDFRLRVSTVSRAAGAMTGRFWHLFPPTGPLPSQLPTVEPGADLAQLSFHPSRVPAGLLTRAPQVLPTVVSVGEFRHPSDMVLFARDLAVGMRGGRLYLTRAGTGTPLELIAPTAINFLWNHHTPPLARFLAEISRAATPQVTWFDWGVAWALPATPELRYRRTTLVAARWKLRAGTLPGRTASLDQWSGQLHAWMERCGVPSRVLLTEDDQQLPLDLNQDMHLDLLRNELSAAPGDVVVLHQAPPPDADGWIDGRAHSLIVPLGARS
ncbi:lantibiotic dehydratase family protein [Streptacidiphilus cavernicola]|uniref:Lantibiotic dehydratase family protein n=1 Tax=Streptacidiphilus cavernicola TaxID=3342716 RepID=A0ABV6VYG7_9ACTN